MQIKIYTTHCPRCKVVEMKLKEKHIDYVECSDVEEMTRLGIISVPYVMVNGKLLNFTETINWIKEQ